MAVTCPPEVSAPNSMRCDTADPCGTDLQVVTIDKESRLIIAVMETELCRVAENECVLTKEVCDINLLVAELELSEINRIELAIGLFLQERETS